MVKKDIQKLVGSIEPKNIIKMTQKQADKLTDKCLMEAVKAAKSRMVKSII